MASSSPSLAALLNLQSSDEFISNTWPKTPFFVENTGEGLDALRALPFLQSLEAMLDAWPQTVQVHLPDVRDEASSMDASSLQARKLFSNGMALLFNNVQSLSPVLNKWLQALRDDLGLPTSAYGRCMVYATPHMKGTAAHFDQNINFVLQLHGTKTWWLSPNTHVENPTQRHTVGLPVDRELESYTAADMPTQQPEPRTKYVLKPGSVLFVPRGMWHSTEADGEALALNFTFSQPCWVDIFTLALRSRLLLSPAWRELADGVTSRSSERRMSAQLELDSLLLELTDDLPNWQAADILGATEGDFSN